MGSINSLAEHLLRTGAETWVEKVLRQTMRNIQLYETNEEILNLALSRTGLAEQYGLDYVPDELLNQNVNVKVNVGMGATDPLMKLRNFLAGIESYAQVLSQVPPGSMNTVEIGKEIFARLGFKDGRRFLSQSSMGDPEKQQMMMQIQELGQAIMQLQQELEDKQADRDVKLIQTHMKETGENQRALLDSETRIEEANIALRNPVVGES